MIEYKIGERVVIRADLGNGIHYGHNNTCQEGNMSPWYGKTVTITRALQHEGFKIREDEGFWDWTPEMVDQAKTLALYR